MALQHFTTTSPKRSFVGRKTFVLADGLVGHSSGSGEGKPKWSTYGGAVTITARVQRGSED